MKLLDYLENKDLLKQADDFATKKHEGQKRRSGEDYINHPRRVAKILKEHGAPQATIAAAYAHDTLEDTPTTYDEIKQEFGTKIAKLVKHVTSDGDEIHKIGKTEFLIREVQHLPKNALTLKLADRLDNVSDIDDSRLNYAIQTIEIVSTLRFDIMTEIQLQLVGKILNTIETKVKLPDEYKNKLSLLQKKSR